MAIALFSSNAIICINTLLLVYLIVKKTPLLTYIKDTGVSQTTLAESVGVTQGAIQQLIKRVINKSREAFVVTDDEGRIASIKELRVIGEQKSNTPDSSLITGEIQNGSH